MLLRPVDSGRLHAEGGEATASVLGEDAALDHLVEIVADQLVLGGRHGVVPLAANADDKLLHTGHNSLHTGCQSHRASRTLEGIHDELPTVQTRLADWLADFAGTARSRRHRRNLALDALCGSRRLGDPVLAGFRLDGNPHRSWHTIDQMTNGEVKIADLNGGIFHSDTGDAGEDRERGVELINLHTELPFLGCVECCHLGETIPSGSQHYI